MVGKLTLGPNYYFFNRGAYSINIFCALDKLARFIATIELAQLYTNGQAYSSNSSDGLVKKL